MPARRTVCPATRMVSPSITWAIPCSALSWSLLGAGAVLRGSVGLARPVLTRALGLPSWRTWVRVGRDVGVCTRAGGGAGRARSSPTSSASGRAASRTSSSPPLHATTRRKVATTIPGPWFQRNPDLILLRDVSTFPGGSVEPAVEQGHLGEEPHLGHATARQGAVKLFQRLPVPLPVILALGAPQAPTAQHRALDAGDVRISGIEVFGVAVERDLRPLAHQPLREGRQAAGAHPGRARLSIEGGPALAAGGGGAAHHDLIRPRFSPAR